MAYMARKRTKTIIKKLTGPTPVAQFPIIQSGILIATALLAVADAVTDVATEIRNARDESNSHRQMS